MGIFKRILATTVATTAIAGAGAALISQNYIYVGEYHTVAPFNPSNLPLVSRLKYKVVGSNDDASSTSGAKKTNPNGNPLGWDFFEKQLDTQTTKKILAKYKTKEELLSAMQKALFLGPTFFPMRFIIGPLLKRGGEYNRVSAFTDFEPKLAKYDLATCPKTKPFGVPLFPANPELDYVWNAEDIKKYTKPFEPKTVIFGMFSLLEVGTRTNGAYFNFAVGSDLFPKTTLHRIDYYTVKNSAGDDNLVFRVTNVGSYIKAGSPAPKDDTNGLHELMTRTMVLDMIRGVDY